MWTFLRDLLVFVILWTSVYSLMWWTAPWGHTHQWWHRVFGVLLIPTLAPFVFVLDICDGHSIKNSWQHIRHVFVRTWTGRE